MHHYQSTLQKNIGGHADDKERERKRERKRKSKQLSPVNVTSELALVHQDEHVESRKLSRLSLGSAYSGSLDSINSSKTSSQKVIYSSLNSASLSIWEDRFSEEQLVSDDPVDYTTTSEKSSLLPSNESIYDSKPSRGNHFIQETSLLDADDTANSSQSFSCKELKQLNPSRAPIPIGPRFQVDVPDWSGPIKDEMNKENSKRSKWLGTRVWPPENTYTKTYKKEIGQGRLDNCSCDPPGSIDCVKLHILEESQLLRSEIGFAFWGWRFNDMGESITKLWTSKQQHNFDSLVKTSVKINGPSYWKLVSKYLRAKDEKKLASYYLNVFIPRRMSLKSRQSLQQQIDSDEEEDSNDDTTGSEQACKGKISSSAKQKYLQWNH